MCGERLVQSGATNLTPGETSHYRVIRTLKFHFSAVGVPSPWQFKIEIESRGYYSMQI